MASVVLTLIGGCSSKDAADGSAATTSEAAATPASSSGRVRGIVQAVAGDTLTVQTYDGKTVTAPIDAKTGYAWVVGSSLATLKDGDFIGTATTGPENAMRAVELVIFPEAMRGTGEGHYDWDVPGVVAANGGDAAASSAMTNGTVDSQSAIDQWNRGRAKRHDERHRDRWRLVLGREDADHLLQGRHGQGGGAGGYADRPLRARPTTLRWPKGRRCSSSRHPMRRPQPSWPSARTA